MNPPLDGPCTAASIPVTQHAPSQAPAYAPTFIFAKKQFDDAFHRLDEEIAAVAKSIPGYLGEESWENRETGLAPTSIYWASLEALQQLVRHPRYIKAKAAQHQWLAGYQVVISQMIRTCGDAGLPLSWSTPTQAEPKNV